VTRGSTEAAHGSGRWLHRHVLRAKEGHVLHRIRTVFLAPIVALAAWTLTQLLGINLFVSTGDGTVGPSDVATAALLAVVAVWVVVQLLERSSRQAQRAWALTGSTSSRSRSSVPP
jgi:Family of unknown function (DUF6069)